MLDIDGLNLKRLLEHAHIGVVIHRWDTSIIYANPTALSLLRLTYEQVIGKDAFDLQWNFLDESGKKILVEDYPVNKVIRQKKRLTNETLGVIDSSREEVSWFMVNAYYEGDHLSDNGFVVVTFTDISDSKQLFSFQDIVENTQDVVVVTDADEIEYPLGPKIVYVNQAFVELTGYSKEESIGETPRILQGALTDEESKARIHEALKKKQAITETLLNYDVKGRPYWIEMSIVPLKNRYGEVTHFAAIERDVSEQKFYQEQLVKKNEDMRVIKRDLQKLVGERSVELQKAKAQLEKIAYFDSLTGIPNRRFFIDQVHKLIKLCDRKGFHLAIGLLDIDDFKRLNDNYGHDLGDAVLQEFGDFMKHFFRADDAFCRYGGEEFAFAVIIDTSKGAESLGKRLLEGIRSLDIRANDTKKLAITASLGMKLCGTAKDLDLDTEIKQADVALYEAKRQGKDRYVFAGV